MPLIERADLVAHSTAPDGPGIVPIQYSQDIIQAAVEASVAMRTFRTMRMPTGTTNLPVLSALPNVGWVNETPLTGAGSTGTIKPATDQGWTNAVLTAEELAAIVVIPEAVIDDASVNLWAEITPRLGEAIAMVVDETVFFGGSSGHPKPATFADGLYTQAAAAGQVANTGVLVDDFNTAFGYIESFTARPLITSPGRPGIRRLHFPCWPTPTRPSWVSARTCRPRCWTRPPSTSAQPRTARSW